MSVPLHSSTPTDRILIRLERERKNEAEGRAAAWGFLWTLFAFKMATVGLIWWAATGSGEDIGYIIATTWYWLLIPIAAITGPLLIRWRMVKLRRRREALVRSEWMSDAESAAHVTSAPTVPWDRSRPDP